MELRGWPGGSVRSQEFAADPEAAREAINADVKRTTNGLIPEALGPGAVDTRTVAVLVNALYLKLAWVNRFQEGATKDAAFRALGGAHEVPTMRLQEWVGYHAAAGWQAATLPAEEGVDVVLLLPDGDLAEAEAALDEATLAELLTGGRRREVALYLPRFRLEEQYSLNGTLRSLGVAAMFDAADFTPMFAGEDIFVDSVDHQAVLRVDEHGFEGAAATTVRFATKAMVRGPEPLVLRFDRPFLAFVLHRETGAIYFSARVTDV
jgi:serpin B